MRVECFDHDARCSGSPELLPVRLFAQAPGEGWASVGAAVATRIRIERFSIPPVVRDLFRIALSVVAADHGVCRERAQDGWTRQIELSVPVEDLDLWRKQRSAVERMLRFLTGDIWNLEFTSSKGHPFYADESPRFLKGATVALLSGGADSLVGAIDLSSSKTPWTAVSQTSSETQVQSAFAEAAKATRHLPWTHGVHIPFESEGSQRARSMGFFAFGIIAGVATEAYHSGEPITLCASENGLISLNPALTPARIGSASTRTTHPCFIGQLQLLLNNLGINVQLENPYQLKTKGEMYSECTQRELFETLASKSMSCGKSGRINMHCGRCVPCIIRRAAFRQSGIPDATRYQYGPGAEMNGFRQSDDVRCAYIGSANHADRDWVERAVMPFLFECSVPNRNSLVDVAQRGLKEVHDYLVGALR